MARLLVLDQSRRVARWWTVARWGALAATAALLGALVRWPGPALTALWYVIIPLLPATFFMTPSLWRGVCPLATLSEWGNRLGRPRELTPRTIVALRAGGLGLFLLLVPARHLLFNQDGPALAGVVVGVAAMALLLGALFPVRSAWCNALCPVLPVELLYGQAPLLPVERGRCVSCTVCTPRGCLDLARGKTVRQVLGPVRRSHAWLASPHGVFFAALPGFIVGYNAVGDLGMNRAPVVYQVVLGWSLASLVLCAGLVTLFRVSSRVALPVLAGLAGGVYYWFAGPAIAEHLGLSSGASLAIQGGGIGVVVWWAVRLGASQSPAITPSAAGNP